MEEPPEVELEGVLAVWMIVESKVVELLDEDSREVTVLVFEIEMATAPVATIIAITMTRDIRAIVLNASLRIICFKFIRRKRGASFLVMVF